MGIEMSKSKSDVSLIEKKSEVSEAGQLPEKIGESSVVSTLPEKIGKSSETSVLPEKIELKNKNDVDEHFSTYEERLNQTPKENSERGDWEGQRGESKFIPNDQEIKDILEEYGLDGVTYKDGIPDFSKASESTVKIENMTENRAENFKQCDERCSEQWNKEKRNGKTDWTARDVAQWRREHGYSWHERNDMKTCDLIPSKINDYFGHLGGVSECKKRDAINNGGDFDE